MKHGRPDKEEFFYAGKIGDDSVMGWRREHAARVFQAIQALLWAHEIVVSGAELASAEYERGFSDASESCLTGRAR